MLHTADALSRAPSMNSVNNTELQQDAETLLNISVQSLPITEATRGIQERPRQGWNLQFSHVSKAGQEPRNTGHTILES